MKHLPLNLLVPAYIRDFTPYTPSPPDQDLMRMYGCASLIRLNNNENPLGPPPSSLEAMRDFPLLHAARYPSGDCLPLKQHLASRFSLDPGQFLVGNGANEVISFVIKAFCEQGDNIVTADRTFAVYEWVARFSGIEPRLAPLDSSYSFDPEALLNLIDNRTKIIFICNPNNPTGTCWNSTVFNEFMNRVGGERIVVLDEAYCEFVERDDFPDGIRMLADHPNLVVFRTFSKMYGLAGLRIGYLASSRKIVDIVRRTCIVYSVNALAQVAACAALDDMNHLVRTRNLVREGKQYLKAALTKREIPFLAGDGNFVMVRPSLSDTLLHRKLMKCGVMIRTMTSFRFPGWIRITVSTRENMEAFVAALDKCLPQ